MNFDKQSSEQEFDNIAREDSLRSIDPSIAGKLQGEERPEWWDAKLPVYVDEEETKQISDAIIDSYQEEEEHNWIQKYMKNENYYIKDNEGGGDCFFATIRDAFLTIGKKITVLQLRESLASELTPKILNVYEEIYSNLFLDIY